MDVTGSGLIAVHDIDLALDSFLMNRFE